MSASIVGIADYQSQHHNVQRSCRPIPGIYRSRSIPLILLCIGPNARN